MLNYYSTSNGKKKRVINLKHSFLVYILIIFLLQNLTLVSQNTNIKSPALETLIQQIDKNYIPLQWNSGMDEIAKDLPELYYILLGSAMSKQEDYIKKYSSNPQKFNALNNEIVSLIPQITNDYNNINSNSVDFKRLKVSFLKEVYNNALNGNIYPPLNQYFKDNIGKDLSQINMPFILEDKPQGAYKKIAKKDKNEINLFGEVAPKAESDAWKRYGYDSEESFNQFLRSSGELIKKNNDKQN